MASDLLKSLTVRPIREASGLLERANHHIPCKSVIWSNSGKSHQLGQIQKKNLVHKHTFQVTSFPEQQQTRPWNHGLSRIKNGLVQCFIDLPVKVPAGLHRLLLYQTSQSCTAARNHPPVRHHASGGSIDQATTGCTLQEDTGEVKAAASAGRWRS